MRSKHIRSILVGLAVVAFAAAVIYAVFFIPPAERVVPLSHSWEHAVPHQTLPTGIASLSAEQCGSCHKAHYEEWRLSTHAHAWTDLQFQAELKKESSPFMCINCHIPLQNQQEYLVKGLINGDIYRPVKEKNPHFDPILQKEGITCASCHVRNGAVVSRQGNLNAPHAVVKDTAHLSEQLCISCHNANAVVTPTLACTFETGDEWKAGPYYPDKNCRTCHMAEVKRPLVAGFPVRRSHFHGFPGSGIPKFDSLPAHQLHGMAFAASAVQKTYTAAKPFLYQLTLTNAEAGHKLPTGDPERFYWVVFQLRTAEGRLMQADTHRIGERWQWYPTAKKLSDNNMKPKEKRTFILKKAGLPKGSYELAAVVTKHRLSEEAARYNKLGAAYPRFITVFEKKYSFVVK